MGTVSGGSVSGCAVLLLLLTSDGSLSCDDHRLLVRSTRWSSMKKSSLVFGFGLLCSAWKPCGLGTVAKTQLGGT